MSRYPYFVHTQRANDHHSGSLIRGLVRYGTRLYACLSHTISPSSTQTSSHRRPTNPPAPLPTSVRIIPAPDTHKHTKRTMRRPWAINRLQNAPMLGCARDVHEGRRGAAEAYVYDTAYGGVYGWANVRSLAEFLVPQGPLVSASFTCYKTLPHPPSSNRTENSHVPRCSEDVRGRRRVQHETAKLLVGLSSAPPV